MKKLIVVDIEVDKEFEVVDFNLIENFVVIHSKEYGYCRQDLSKIKFTNNQLED